MPKPKTVTIPVKIAPDPEALDEFARRCYRVGEAWFELSRAVMDLSTFTIVTMPRDPEVAP